MGLWWLVGVGLWIPGSGKVVARAVDWAHKNYRRVIKPTLKRLFGLGQKLELTRREDAGDYLVFSIDNIKTIDFEKESGKTSGLENDQFDYLKTMKIEESMVFDPYEKGKKRNEVPSEVFSEPPKRDDGNRYKVILKIKKGTYLGEMEFATWQKYSDVFQTTVLKRTYTDRAEQWIEVGKGSGGEYEKVLRTLRVETIILGEPDLLPDQLVEERIGVSASGVIGKLRGLFDRKARKIVVDQNAGQNPRLSDRMFLEHLANLVAIVGKERGLDVIQGYYDTIVQDIDSDIKIVQKEERIREQEVAAREAEKKSLVRQFWRGITIAFSVAIAALAIAVAFVVFSTGGGVAAAGYTVLALWIPAVFAQITGFLGKLSWLKSLAVVGVAAGALKLRIEYKSERLKIAKEELEIAKEGKNVLRELQSKIQEMGDNIRQTIEGILVLERSSDRVDSVKLSLAGRTITDFGMQITSKFFSKFLQDKTWQPKWGKLQLLLSNCGITADGVACVKDPGVTAVVTSDLASVLMLGLANRLKIGEVDLSGNPIGVRGVEEFEKILQRNLTITSFKYDIEYPDVETFPPGGRIIVGPETQVAIAKQLILNRYLQEQDVNLDTLVREVGEDQSYGLTKEYILQKAFGVGSDQSQALLEKIKYEAVSKIRQRFDVTVQDYTTIRPDLAYILKQNEHLVAAKVAMVSGGGSADILKCCRELIQAYVEVPSEDQASLSYCSEFIRKQAEFDRWSIGFKKWFAPDEDGGWELMGFADVATQTEQEFLISVSELSLPARAALLTTLFSSKGDHSNEIALLARLLDVFDSSHKQILEIPEICKVVIGALSQACLDLGKTDTNIQDFIDRFVSIQKFLNGLEIDSEQDSVRKMASDFIGSIALSRDQGDPYRKMSDWLDSYPTSLAGKYSRFRDFAKLYGKVNLAEFKNKFKGNFPPYSSSDEKLDSSRLRELMQADVYDESSKTTRCSILKTLDEQHRQVLLEICFADETYYSERCVVEKAVLVSRMIGDEAMFRRDSEIVNFREEYLRYSLLRGEYGGAPYAYETLKSKLEEERKEAKRKEETGKIEMLERLLQASLQDELRERFACLHSPFGTDGFDGLEKYLTDRFNLRSFAPYPDGIDSTVKAYIEYITRRNSLYDALFDYGTSSEKLKKFLEIYSTIASHKERQDCLADLVRNVDKNEDGDNLLSEVVYSAVFEEGCDQLTELSEPNRVDLLEACFNDNPNACGFAVMISGLISLSAFGGYVESVWNGKKPFQSCLSELKGMVVRAGNEKLETVRQLAMQADLKARYSCLRETNFGGEKPISYSDGMASVMQLFDALKKELDNNFDLMGEFVFGGFVVSEVREYVKFICKRNEIRACIEQRKPDEFFRQLTSFPSQVISGVRLDLESALEQINMPSVILGIVKMDVGRATEGVGGLWSGYGVEVFSCAHLRKLLQDKPDACKFLLKQCFSSAESTYGLAEEKADLICNLLRVGELFKEENIAKLQSVIRPIYWSICTPSSKGYDCKGLKKQLTIALRSFSEEEDIVKEIRQAVALKDRDSVTLESLVKSEASVSDMVSRSRKIGREDSDG